MNERKALALLRELAANPAAVALVRELLDEMAVEEPKPTPAPPPGPRRVPRPVPEIPVDDIARAKARRLLRRAGVAPR